jgi:hypothetical protein
MKGIMNETANNIKGISAWDNFMIFLAGLWGGTHHFFATSISWKTHVKLHYHAVHCHELFTIHSWVFKSRITFNIFLSARSAHNIVSIGGYDSSVFNSIRIFRFSKYASPKWKHLHEPNRKEHTFVQG